MTTQAIEHIEVPGQDRKTLAEFYSTMFGWEATHNDELNYTSLTTGNLRFGISPADSDEPGLQTIYIHSENLDSVLKSVTENGGSPAGDKIDIPGLGAIGLFKDPTGNVIGLMNFANSDEKKTGREFVFIEISAEDGKRAGDWYAKHFGWTAMYIEEMDYAMFDSGSLSGGFPQLSEFTKAGMVLVYVDSEDIEADLKQIESLKGKVVMPKTEIPETGHFAVFNDPEGNTLGLYTAMGN